MKEATFDEARTFYRAHPLRFVRALFETILSDFCFEEPIAFADGTVSYLDARGKRVELNDARALLQMLVLLDLSIERLTGDDCRIGLDALIAQDKIRSRKRLKRIYDKRREQLHKSLANVWITDAALLLRHRLQGRWLISMWDEGDA